MLGFPLRDNMRCRLLASRGHFIALVRADGPGATLRQRGPRQVADWSLKCPSRDTSEDADHGRRIWYAQAMKVAKPRLTKAQIVRTLRKQDEARALCVSRKALQAEGRGGHIERGGQHQGG